MKEKVSSGEGHTREQLVKMGFGQGELQDPRGNADEGITSPVRVPVPEDGNNHRRLLFHPLSPNRRRKAPAPDLLGHVVATYQVHRGLRAPLWLGAPAVLAPLLYGAERARYGYANFGPVAGETWSRPWFLLATLALAAFSLWVLVRILQERHLVSVHRLGLRVRTPLSKMILLPWDQIAGISTSLTEDYFLGLTMRKGMRARLFPNMGSPIPLDERLPNLPELISHIKVRLYPRLLPVLKETFEAGRWLYFGRVAIRKEELRVYRSSRISGKPRLRLSWDQVDKIDLQCGFLRIHSRESQPSRPYRIAAGDIPNLELLLQMVREL